MAGLISQGNLLPYETCLEWLQDKWIPVPPNQNLKSLYRGFTALSHMYCADGLSITALSEGCILENSSHCGKTGETVHSKAGDGVRKLRLLPSSFSVNQDHILSMTFSLQSFLCFLLHKYKKKILIPPCPLFHCCHSFYLHTNINKHTFTHT